MDFIDYPEGEGKSEGSGSEDDDNTDGNAREEGESMGDLFRRMRREHRSYARSIKQSRAKLSVNATPGAERPPARARVSPRSTFSCAVCLEDISGRRVVFCGFSCGNQFHAKCTHQLPACPLCRHSVPWRVRSGTCPARGVDDVP